MPVNFLSEAERERFNSFPADLSTGDLIADDVLAEGLDGLLQAPELNRLIPLASLRQSATSNSPKTILAGLNKLEKLLQWQVDDWNLSAVNPNRRKQLAQIGFGGFLRLCHCLFAAKNTKFSSVSSRD